MKRILIPIFLVAGLLFCMAYLYQIGLSIAVPRAIVPTEAIPDRIVAGSTGGSRSIRPNPSDLAILPPENIRWIHVIQANGSHTQTSGIKMDRLYPNNDVSLMGTDILTQEEQIFNQVEPSNIIILAPIYTGLHCDNCHGDSGEATLRGGITPTGSVDTNILSLHDMLWEETYPEGHTGALMDRTPVQCTECHASQALDEAGYPGVLSLSDSLYKIHSSSNLISEPQ